MSNQLPDCRELVYTIHYFTYVYVLNTIHDVHISIAHPNDAFGVGIKLISILK